MVARRQRIGWRGQHWGGCLVSCVLRCGEVRCAWIEGGTGREEERSGKGDRGGKGEEKPGGLHAIMDFKPTMRISADAILCFFYMQTNARC